MNNADSVHSVNLICFLWHLVCSVCLLEGTHGWRLKYLMLMRVSVSCVVFGQVVCQFCDVWQSALQELLISCSVYLHFTYIYIFDMLYSFCSSFGACNFSNSCRRKRVVYVFYIPPHVYVFSQVRRSSDASWN